MTALDRLLAGADDPNIVVSADGLLAEFNDAGVLGPLDVLSAMTIGRIEDETDFEVLLAAALAVRGTRYGHVCIRLGTQRGSVFVDGQEPEDIEALPWPEPETWSRTVASSGIVGDGDADRPLVLIDDRLYLQRYHTYEEGVARFIHDRAQIEPKQLPADLEVLLDEQFPPADESGPSRQRRAAGIALATRFAVIAGGPGTGKTRTIAMMLAALARSDAPFPLVALAAPTGKAAARLGEAVTSEADALDATAAERLGGVEASTIHRLLGFHHGRGRFRHDKDNRLPHDIVIVDEMSMVSLPLAAKLLAAVRDDASVVFVGDPHQLESIEAGTVLADIVGPATPETPLGADTDGIAISGRVVVLDRVYRFSEIGGISDFADAVRRGDADEAISLLSVGSDDLGWVSDDTSEAFTSVVERVVEHRIRLVEIAMTQGRTDDALAELDQMAVLSAHHQGPQSVEAWRRRIEDALDERFGGLRFGTGWYPGQPVMITSNDYTLDLYNGDIGVTVATEDGLRVAFARGGVRTFPRSHIGDHTTVHAMTIHKSQGSGFTEVVVALPAESSRLLTRELLYTAVTRATTKVTIVGDEAVIRHAVNRSVERASGLGSLLWRRQP